MNQRETNISRIREIAGTYKNKKQLIDTCYDKIAYDEQWEYAVQYIQLVNRKGVPANWYNDELSRLLQVTVISHPDKRVTVLPYYLTR